jgi:hypothetical protein
MKMPDRPLRVTMVNKYYSPPHLGGVDSVVRTQSVGRFTWDRTAVATVAVYREAFRRWTELPAASHQTSGANSQE